ncbi:MAG: LysR family transcriptional regulator [Oscillospiraceae bacterium]|nr:LysR family transcriptional regulator [Oscillospiraceae bacterium]
MDIKNLTTFLHVAEQGSFSKAAECLGYSQPTVSVQIRQLEQELGVRLFDRIGHAVRLTDTGRDALLYAQKICRLCRQMTAHDSSAQKDHLIRLATSDSLCSCLFENSYADLRALHPNIRLKLITAGTDELFRLLDHNEVDLVCTLDSHIYNTNYIIAAERQIGVHFIVSAKDPLSRQERLTVEELLSHDVLLTEHNMSYRRQLDDWLAERSKELCPVLETGRTDLICSLVEQGLGIAFLPDYVTDAAVQRGSICRLTLEDFRPTLWQQLLYHREKWISPAMQAIVDLLTKNLQTTTML